MKNTKIGDVFVVNIDSVKKKYFQYVVSDLTQLNSDVIRAFKYEYEIDAVIDLLEIVKGEVEFYAHCITKLGMQMGLWERVGNVKEIGTLEHILFRNTDDFGNPQVKVSKKWWIWRINQPQQYVGVLTGSNKFAEIGIVFNPLRIISRMKNEEYSGAYPAFE